MPTIALLLESDGPGGAEQMLINLAVELHRRGHGVVPVGPANGCGWLAGEFVNRGFEPATFRLRAAVDPACVTGLAGLFRDRGVDLVHSHEFTMAVYGAAAARRRSIPHLITMHGGKGWAERWRRRAAMRWAVRASGGIVAVSDPTRLELERILGANAKVSVVPNGVPRRDGDRARFRSELGLADDESLIVAVGNLYPVKGHAVLIHALAETEASRPWRLAIAGRGEEEPRLRAMAAEHGLVDRVHLLGYRPDIPDLLAAADIFAMPSLSEGLPLAVIEAMFSGRAIIASSVGGIPDALADGDAGMLVRPGDAGQLSAGLTRLLEDPDLRRSLGSAAQQRAEAEFTTSRMADAYEAIYRRLLN